MIYFLDKGNIRGYERAKAATYLILQEVKASLKPIIPQNFLGHRMESIEQEIQNMVDRETNAWNNKDAEELVSIFHHDMVWPWPPDPDSHDPALWVCPMGRYNRERWKKIWQDIFDTHDLVHNHRSTIRIHVTEQRDGAFAVVDVDTLWRDRTGRDFHWKGRACKGYSLVGNEWKLIFHSGLLNY